MKIIHCCFACFYIDNYAYQENMLPLQNYRDGHEVLVLASTLSFKDGKEAYVEPRSYISEHGFPVIRLPYTKFGPAALTNKMKLCSGIIEQFEAFKPDVIYIHGLCSLSTLVICKYKKEHPSVCILSDTHADANNSGRNWISLNILHRVIWRSVIQKTIGFIEKVFCISDECLDFAKRNFLVPDDKLEWHPLGVMCFPEDQYESVRERKRCELGITSDQIMFAHTGKMDALKRTLEILRAFKSVNADNIRLVIGGMLLSDIKEEAENLISEDDRIQFIGWQNQSQMNELLCATDVYVQPGGQSATMQNSMGCGCALMLYPHASHKRYLHENGRFVETQTDMVRVFTELSKSKRMVEKMGKSSYDFSRKYLDYPVLARRIDECYLEFRNKNNL